MSSFIGFRPTTTPNIRFFGFDNLAVQFGFFKEAPSLIIAETYRRMQLFGDRAHRSRNNDVGKKFIHFKTRNFNPPPIKDMPTNLMFWVKH